jgi:hypothetical protein
MKIKDHCLIDSGLSLTTVRDVTELESDRDLKSISRSSKQYRSMPVKRNNDDTDSDGIFDEVIRLLISIEKERII